jgi:hypothetical protein
VADEVHTMSDAERDALLDGWAENEFDEGMARVREQRNALLASSDWTQVTDSPVDSAAWAKYRQELRDLPGKTDDPADPKWPKAPGA